MTAQTADMVIFKGEQYALVGIEGDRLATPEKYGMEPESISTGCRRGFYATYELLEDGLYLKEMTLREKHGNYCPIGGVEPTKERYQSTYHNLNEWISFSGKIRLAKDFIREYYIHMGFQKPSAFETVFDITLQNSRITSIKDRSQDMAMKRGQFKDYYESGDFFTTIVDAFSLDLDLE